MIWPPIVWCCTWWRSACGPAGWRHWCCTPSAAGGHLDLATRRFSALAAAAFVVMAASGVVNAAVRVPLGQVFDGAYGFVVLAKGMALVVVGWLGWRQRTVAVTALAADPADRRAFTRLAVVESAVLAVTVGLGVALGRTPPPVGEQRDPSLVEEVLGYGLDGAPTPVRMLTEWRFDLLLGTAAVVLAALYLLGVRRVRAAGGRWPLRRTVGWLLGCLVLLLATSSGVGRYAPAVFSVHLAATAAIAVVAPLCLVLGAPLTLAARTVRPRPDGAAPGARDWLRAMYASTPVRALTHPAVAVAAFVGTFYLLYLAGLYDALAGSHVAHVLTNVWLLAVGSLFFWVTVGLDPLPRPPGAHGPGGRGGGGAGGVRLLPGVGDQRPDRRRRRVLHLVAAGVLRRPGRRPAPRRQPGMGGGGAAAAAGGGAGDGALGLGRRTPRPAPRRADRPRR